MKLNVNRKFIFVLLLSLCVNCIHTQTFEEKHFVKNVDLFSLAEEAFVTLKSSDVLINNADKLIDNVNELINNVKERINYVNELMNYELNTSDLKDLVFYDGLNNLGSIKCYTDLMYVYSSLVQPNNTEKGWATQMIDAFSKPESGILEGNLKWIGNYDECLKVYAPPSKLIPIAGDFNGKYCTLQITININEKSSLPISIGTCLPDSCKPSDLPANITTSNNGSLPVFSNITLTCQPTTKKFTSAAIGFTFLLSLLVLLALLGSSITAYEYFISGNEKETAASADSLAGLVLQGDTEQKLANDNDTEKQVDCQKRERHLPIWIQQCKPFLNCFCVFSNGGKLLDTTEVKGQMLCLHGIRFLSIVWVILCHVYSMCLAFTKNPVEALIRIDHLPFQIVTNGFFSVDSFFLLSGFLLAYLYFQQAAKSNGKIPWLYFYAHRYIRLTPVYMIVLGFYTCINPLLGSGPLWTANDIDPVCRRNWWWNLLYINNLQHSENSCMTFSWYLANDMQFFVLSPLFLITLWRWPRFGISLLSLFASATFATNFGLTYHYKLLSGIGNIAAKGQDMKAIMLKFAETTDKLYVRPYTRMAPYLVGIALAYYMYKRGKTDAGKDKPHVLIIGWFLSTIVTLTIQFGLYDRQLSLLEASFYNGFSHICFALGVAWIIYVCLTEQASIVNGILSFKGFLPLSRLTYCAYLVHPMIMSVYFGSLRDLLYFSHLNMVIIFMAVFALSFIAAFVTSLLCESPIIRLEKLVRTKFSEK